MHRASLISTLPELLDKAAADRPDAEALCDGRDRLTWRQYRNAAAAVADELTASGIGPGDRVGVMMPKSVRSFVAVHAVQRIGGVMVPVDWFAPPAYTIEVLADAGAAAVVGPIASGARAAVAAVAPVVVDPATVETAERAEPTPPHRCDVDDPAYIIYTSGSTGRPKGIVHTHASALAYARLAVETYGLTSEDRLANIAPLHFDQSTFELYAGPLAQAAAIVVPDTVMRFPASLAAQLASERASVLYTVPYVITQLVERGAAADHDLSALRWVKFGGESFDPAALRAAMGALPSARFSNVYGPAEVNQCTYHHLAAPPTSSAPIPIGRPWPGVTVRIVDTTDEHGPGELWVHAPTAMRGYWNRPELTDAALTVDDGRCWYHTGDLVQRSPGGDLTFLGRVDHQVKVRGQRIELEAVDAVLLAHPSVDAAVCYISRDGSEERLVALVSPPLSAEGIDDVRRHAIERLPRYAVPTLIDAVATLPRTSTGKVDRRAASLMHTSSTESTAEPR